MAGHGCLKSITAIKAGRCVSGARTGRTPGSGLLSEENRSLSSERERTVNKPSSPQIT